MSKNNPIPGAPPTLAGDLKLTWRKNTLNRRPHSRHAEHEWVTEQGYARIPRPPRVEASPAVGLALLGVSAALVAVAVALVCGWLP